MTQKVIDQARRALSELLALTGPGGGLHDNHHRGEVSSRAKWLLRALDKAEGIATPDGRTEPTDEEHAGIEARITEARREKAGRNQGVKE